MYFIRKFGTDGFNFIDKGHKVILLMLILAEPAVEFNAECYFLSEFSEITLAKYIDLAFVIILLHRWHCCLQLERSRDVRDLRHVRSKLWRRVLAFFIS